MKSNSIVPGFCLGAMLLLCGQLAIAAHLNGNLDYSVREDRGIVYLTLTNRIPGNSIYLQSLSLHQVNGTDLPIFTSPGQLIASSVTVKLGSIAELITQHPLSEGSRPIQEVSVSETPCQHGDCNNQPIIVNFKTYVPHGMTTLETMALYLRYY